ncbi:MAG: PHB depolymerase family esterase [Bacteroidetes bacterium]|nr:PHB depolymerase family esterase [Bacteroidota bacterium]
MSKQLGLVFLFLLVYCSVNIAQSKLLEIPEFGSNPGNLKLFVHTPNNSDTLKRPLVIVLHGCSQTANEVAELTGWNKLSDLHNFIVLYPQQKFINNSNHCFNWFEEKDITKGQGECQSIFEMIVYAQKKYSIDSTRIFITGLSAGAAMSVAMAATHPNKFNNAAVFAGTAYGVAQNVVEGFKVMRGKKTVSQTELVKLVTSQNSLYKGAYSKLIIYHGTGDGIVNYSNATLLLKQWAGIQGCDTIPDKTEKSFAGIPEITRLEYQNTKGEQLVSFYQITNLGHRLLIHPGNKEEEGGRMMMFATDKGFHSTYHVAKEFGILKK